MRGYGLDPTGTLQFKMAGSCECGNEHACCVKGGNFVTSLSDCYILKKGFDPSSQFVEIRIVVRGCGWTDISASIL